MDFIYLFRFVSSAHTTRVLSKLRIKGPILTIWDSTQDHPNHSRLQNTYFLIMTEEHVMETFVRVGVVTVYTDSTHSQVWLVTIRPIISRVGMSIQVFTLIHSDFCIISPPQQLATVMMVQAGTDILSRAVKTLSTVVECIPILNLFTLQSLCSSHYVTCLEGFSVQIT